MIYKMIKRMLLIANTIVVLGNSVVVTAGVKQNSMSDTNFIAKVEKSGVILKRGKEKLKVEFINPEIVRVQYVPEGDLKENDTNICVTRSDSNTSFKFSEKGNTISLESKQLKVLINKTTGSIQYKTSKGEVLLNENPLQPRITEKVNVKQVEFDQNQNKIEKTANGDVIVSEVTSQDVIGTAWKAIQQFVWQKNEALFGLGSHQENYMNLRGTMQYLYQHNLKKSVPVLMSSKGYGLLFDSGSTMIFHDDSIGSYMQMNTVKEIDYYFMYGPEFDHIISHYRTLTGKVQIMPKYIFGYIQSKERYKNPHDIDSVINRFRTEKIPLDVIVQDWNYWDSRWWGHKKFDERFYPNPDEMIRNVHEKNVHYMLSIWPSATGNEATEMKSKGFLLGWGIYDAFNPAARKMYWNEYVNKNLFSKGVDAWWCDSSEPVDGDWNNYSNSVSNNAFARYEINSKALNDLLGPFRANTFSLHHAQGIYENQRLQTNVKRVVNLTRSGFAGLQRYGTFVWNGDTKATWSDFAQQIPSGLNYMATGLPYWTIDAGAFFVKSNSQWFWKGNFDKGTEDMGYREFYVRNIQFCQWLPMFRSHGTDFTREPWAFGKPGEPFYESIVKQIQLRYRLLPYIYSVAAMVANQDYTMTRLLAFDFRKDTNVYNIKDQFLFGPSIMACPITTPMYYDANSKKMTGVSTTRSVYLPKGTNWIDFWTGKQYLGGTNITADAPIDHIPVFVRSGAIIPMAPVQQYSSETPAAPYEIRIYPGADGVFTIYEDEGDNYNYEYGKFAQITLRWNNKTKTLSISDRKGEFAGMINNRLFRIVFVKENHGVGVDITESVEKSIVYEGKRIDFKLQ